MALMAVLAIAAVTAASASAALPEFYNCVSVKAGAGKYKNSTCTEEATSGSFEKKPLEKAVSFTMKGAAVLESAADTLSCSSFSGSGETKGSREVTNVKGTFKECNEVLGCGREPTVNLKGRLGYLSHEGKKEAGLLLEPAEGQTFLKCKTNILGLEVYGSAIGSVPSRSGEMVTAFGLAYRQALTKQEWTHFEGEEVVHGLEFYSETHKKSEGKVGISATFEVKLAEDLEIRQ